MHGNRKEVISPYALSAPGSFQCLTVALTSVIHHTMQYQFWFIFLPRRGGPRVGLLPYTLVCSPEIEELM